MAALTADIPTTRYGVPGNAHQPENFPLLHNVTVYGGSIAITRAGYLVPPTTPSTTDIVVGVIDRYATSAGGTTDGAVTAEVAQGTFFLRCGTGSDALTQADVNQSIYLIDEQTVGKTNGGSTRPVAGTLRNIDTTRFGDQFAVTLGTAAPGTGVGV